MEASGQSTERGAIGVDLAQNVLQLHDVGAEARLIARLQLRHAQVRGVFKRLEPRRQPYPIISAGQPEIPRAVPIAKMTFL